MRFGLRQQRYAVATRSLSFVLVAITVGLGAVAAAYLSQGSSPATPNTNSSSSSSSSAPTILSSSSSTSSSSTVMSADQAAATPYPLVWGQNPIHGCAGIAFCLNVTLGFSGKTATNNTASSATTIIQGNATTIITSS